jgi:hypothetical protein
MVERKDLEAALEARRELGPAYEDELVDGFLAKIDQRLATQRPAPPEEQRTVTPLLLGSIGLGIPVTAIALSNAHGGGGIAVAIVAWIAIGAANVAAILRKR